MSKGTLLTLHQLLLVLLVINTFIIGVMIGTGYNHESTGKRVLFGLLSVFTVVSGILVGLLALALALQGP